MDEHERKVNVRTTIDCVGLHYQIVCPQIAKATMSTDEIIDAMVYVHTSQLRARLVDIFAFMDTPEAEQARSVPPIESPRRKVSRWRRLVKWVQGG